MNGDAGVGWRRVSVICMIASVAMSAEGVVDIVVWYGKNGRYVQSSLFVFLLYKHGGIGSARAHYQCTIHLHHTDSIFLSLPVFHILLPLSQVGPVGFCYN